MLPFLFGTPSWVATELDGHGCGEAECATVRALVARGARRLARIRVQAVAERYGPGGEFWTENPTVPDAADPQLPDLERAELARVLRPEASRRPATRHCSTPRRGAIRTADPGAEIDPRRDGGSSRARRRRPRRPSTCAQLYKVNGVEANFDGIAVHPYGSSVAKVANQVEAFRKVAKRAGDRGAGTWITELGWGSAKGGNPLNRGKKGQAQRLKESFKYFKQQRKKLNIQTIHWFSWRDSCDQDLRLVREVGPVLEEPQGEAFVQGVHEVHRRELEA